MIDISHFPAILFLVAAPALWLAARFGVWLGKRHPLDDEVRHDFGLLQGTALTLPGLIIAFSFSMSAVLGPAAATPTPVMALVVSGMNDVLNSQGYTQAAWWNRIPASPWGLMIAIALGCNFLVGYGARSFLTAKRLLFIFPGFIAIAFAFIADIDSPRHGLIRVAPQNLISLAISLPPP